MAVALYADHNVPRAIITGLRLQNVDILTAYEESSNELNDPTVLDRANTLARVLFTQDRDLLIEATRRQRSNVTFHGVIYAHQLLVSIGKCVDDLELIAKAAEPEDVINQIIYLPL